MPRKVIKPNRFLLLTDDLGIIAAPQEHPEPTVRRVRRRRRITSGSLIDRSLPMSDPLLRTRRLVMAALRVWELKHGIHDPF